MRFRAVVARLAPLTAVVGAGIAVAGIAYLIFTQVSLNDDELLTETEHWSYAATALTVIAFGLLVVALAQLTRLFATRKAPRSDS